MNDRRPNSNVALERERRFFHFKNETPIVLNFEEEARRILTRRKNARETFSRNYDAKSGNSTALRIFRDDVRTPSRSFGERVSASAANAPFTLRVFCGETARPALKVFTG